MSTNERELADHSANGQTQLEPVETAFQYATRIKTLIAQKAHKNKNLSTFLFLVVLVSTVVAPVLILISYDFYFSKVFPAFLSAGAALSSYWIQLRKPHERWVIYRTAQREIEFEMDQHQFGNGHYDVLEKDKILSDKVSKRALQLHYEWMPLVPKTEELQHLTKQKK